MQVSRELSFIGKQQTNMPTEQQIKQWIQESQESHRHDGNSAQQVDASELFGTPLGVLTTQDTSITHTAPSTPDFAIQDLTQTTPFGFVTQDEGNTVLQVILNLQVRVLELENRLEELGLVVSN